MSESRGLSHALQHATPAGFSKVQRGHFQGRAGVARVGRKAGGGGSGGARRTAYFFGDSLQEPWRGLRGSGGLRGGDGVRGLSRATAN